MNIATTVRNYSAPKGAPAAARSALRLLQNLRHGALTLHLPDGSLRRYGEHPQQHAMHTPHHPLAQHSGPAILDLQKAILPATGALPT